MIAAVVLNIVLHAQMTVPWLGSNQPTPGAPTVSPFRPIVLTVAATNAQVPKPVILVPGRPIVIR
jgi:hypothetical protein